MKDNLIIEINKIIGTTANYKGEDYYFERFKEISTGKICIYTHKTPLIFFENEIEEFLNSLSESKAVDLRDKSMISINNKILQGFTPSAENIEMKSTLLEMMAKVKSTPAAIPQAKQVCEIVNTMVNIQKTELEMIKIIDKNKF